MILSTCEKYATGRLVSVYSLTEDWANNGESGFSMELYTSRDDAVREFKLRLRNEANSGIIADLGHKSQFVEEAEADSYECYVDGSYCEHHFHISVEEKELRLSDGFIRMIADLKVGEARIADFISQIEQWEKVGKLTDEQYQELIYNPDLPDLISSALSKNDAYLGAYWESICEVGHQLIHEAVNSKKEEIAVIV